MDEHSQARESSCVRGAVAGSAARTAVGPQVEVQQADACVRHTPPLSRRAFAAGLAALLAGGLSRPQLAYAKKAGKNKAKASARGALKGLVPREQEEHFKTLGYPVVVTGSPYTDKALRRKLRDFRLTVHQLEQAGVRVGVVIRDLGTGASLSYAQNELFYPASSIKGVYINCLYESLEQGELAVSKQSVASLASPTIIYSDNDTYLALRNLCGNQVFIDWCVAEGAVSEDDPNYARIAGYNYPFIMPAQLARMWEHSFEYFDAGSDDARQLLELYERREVSPLRAGIPSAELVIAKAGWYPVDIGEKWPATVDAGIVMEGGHSYVVVIMTSLPADLDWLTSVVGGLFAGHTALV